MKAWMLLSGLLLAACDTGAKPGAPNDDTAIAAANANVDVSGAAIRIAGSSTVYPFTKAVAESFKRFYPNAETPVVESTGTGDGFGQLCGSDAAKRPDIVDASRRMTAEELASCEASGVGAIIEVPIGLDGIVLAQAIGAADLDVRLQDIYRAASVTTETGARNTAKLWSDVNPELPKRPIRLMGPPSSSGTRDRFVELMMHKGCRQIDALAKLEDSDPAAFEARCSEVRSDAAYIEAGENDSAIVAALAKDDEAIGIFGYSFLEENPKILKPVLIDGRKPEAKQIESSAYPASRQLYLYVRANQLAAKPALGVFIGEYLKPETSGADGFLAKRGFIALPPWTRAEAVKRVADRAPLTAAGLEAG